MMLRYLLPSVWKVPTVRLGVRGISVETQKKIDDAKQEKNEKLSKWLCKQDALVEIVKKYAPLTSPQLYKVISEGDSILSGMPKFNYKRLLKSSTRNRLIFMLRHPDPSELNFLVCYKKNVISPLNPDLCPNTSELQPFIKKYEELEAQRQVRLLERQARKKRAAQEQGALDNEKDKEPEETGADSETAPEAQQATQ